MDRREVLELFRDFVQYYAAQLFLRKKGVDIKRSTAEKLFEIYCMFQDRDKLYYVDVSSQLGISQSNARRLLKLYAYIFDYVYRDGWLIKDRPLCFYDEENYSCENCPCYDPKRRDCIFREFLRS